jgi:hypothetical protein
MDGSAPRRWALLVAAMLLALLVGLAAAGCGGGDDKASAEKGQTVRFQKPTESGPDPFTKATDIEGEDRVKVGSGPFGGTGSDLVCDRELLITSLKARPERMKAWADVVGIKATVTEVEQYIRDLKPVTLTRDARVTNHSFVGTKASPYQAILQAGTAVLVDNEGHYRARCRCGNPLLEPVFIPEAICYGCPPNYTPPEPCEPESECWEEYPNPPEVKGEKSSTTGARPPSQGESPTASFSPQTGRQGDAFTLNVSGFAPNTSLRFTLTRPDGVVENYTINTDGSGRGSYGFRPSGQRDVTGTYRATVTNPDTGASTSATAVLLPAEEGGSEPVPPPDDSQTQTETEPGNTPPDDGSGGGFS